MLAIWPAVVDQSLRPRVVIRLQQPSLRERLGPEGVAALIEAYQDGTTAPELAAIHGVSLKTIKRLLASERGRLKDYDPSS